MAPSNESADARLIVALDFPDAKAALDLVDRLEGATRWFKIGLELYVAEGNSLVAELKQLAATPSFLISSSTIFRTPSPSAVRSVARVGAHMLTVHAAGGPAVLSAAAEAAGETGPILLAVTVLTSMDDAQLAATGCHWKSSGTSGDASPDGVRQRRAGTGVLRG